MSDYRKIYYSYLKAISGIYRLISPFSVIGTALSIRSVDLMRRYELLFNEISTDKVILEIGSNGLSPLAQCYKNVVSIDIKNTPGIDVIASASNLPFKSNRFDAVTAMDCIEHMPRNIRDIAIMEFIRVSKDKVIVHTPLEDGKDFKGRKYDSLLQEWYMKIHGKSLQNTEEHLLHIEPSPDYMKQYGFHISGDQNAELWFKYNRLQYLLPFLMMPFTFFIAQVYYRLCSNKDNLPPYWGGICIYNKT